MDVDATLLLTLEDALRRTSVAEARERMDLATLADAVGRQARSIAEMDGAIQQVAAGAGEAAAAAEGAAAHAVELTRLADTGRQDLDAIRARLTEVEATARQTNEQVTRLLAEVGAIGRIAATVQRIAAHTQMLSLNAAIEAAHAGDRGRGFAVVAQEVRRLAEQASASARDITQIVSQLENGIGTTGQAVKALAGAASTAAGESEAARGRLAGMYGLLTEVAGAVDQTAQTAEAQASIAEEMAAAAEELRQQADTVAQTADAMGQRQNGNVIEGAYRALGQYRYGGQFEWALDLARTAADEVGRVLAASGVDLSDTNYTEITGTTPPKYRTRYSDRVNQQAVAVIDRLIAPVRDRIPSIGVVDLNGFALAVTDHDRMNRIFNDAVGLKAARVGQAGEEFLVQTYARDTGLVVMDIAVPVFVAGRQYGAVRLGLVAET